MLQVAIRTPVPHVIFYLCPILDQTEQQRTDLLCGAAARIRVPHREYPAARPNVLCHTSGLCCISPVSPVSCLSCRPGPGSSPQQVDAGQTSGSHVSPALLRLPVLLLPHRVQHLHLRQPAHVPGRLRRTRARLRTHTYADTLMLICAHTLLSVGQTAAFGWKDAGEKNRKLDFYILKGIVADPDRGGVTLLCI